MKTTDVLLPDERKTQFVACLTEWYLQNKRDLPWRRQNNDPYRVWLSEIMLQQTRVTAAIPYYERFLKELPTIEHLADASEEQLFKLWEGLGYYSRARNLQKAARVIVQEHGGMFPRVYEQILQLPGIGAYTAGAIASICFDQPVPAVDGNVLRVIARVEERMCDMSAQAVKNEIREVLMRVYPKTGCGDFTQALMELGATVCIPGGKPKCGDCPVAQVCKVFQSGTVADIPLKKPPKTRRREKITVLVLIHGGQIAIRKRAEKGLLAGMWEFPNCAGWLMQRQALSLAADWGAAPDKIIRTEEKVHIFTHIEWHMRFYLIACNEGIAKPAPFVWADKEALHKTYAIPAAFRINKEPV